VPTDPVSEAEAKAELTPAKAVVLGVVEGVTEFLPISSTGHLLISERLMNVGKSDLTKDAADTYTVAIQSGAILAVLLLYWRRLWSMVEGAIGRDPVGRRTLSATVVAFIPAAVIGVLFENAIKDHLLQPLPVIIAWIVGGIAILLFARRWDEHHEGNSFDTITLLQAAIIGGAQVLSLWPGTSRSLVTILAALAVGLSLPAAVEFSFILGFVTLGAATAYELLKDGHALFQTYSASSIIIGLVAAFISAAIAIRWMVTYLQRHSFAIFGWWRIGVAILSAILLAAGKL
jgi:undecaprenyl-diphosphatase